MKIIKKYLLFAFLIENIAAQTSLLGSFSDIFFYTFLAIGGVLLFFKEIWSVKTFKACWWAYVLAFIYVVYEFGIGTEWISQRTILYLIAKITTFVIIIVSVRTNFLFYKDTLYYPLAIVLLFFIVYGLITGQGMDDERMRLGYTNPNTTSWMSAVAIGCLIFSGVKWNLKNIVLLVVGVLGLLAGGSRAGMLFLMLIVIIRYGINFKILLPMGVGYVIAFFLLPTLGIHTVGLQRMQDTMNGTESNNREMERTATIMMIEERPITGWGFEAHNQGRAASITELGAHSGYLETLKFMGYPMGIAWISVLVLASLGTALKMQRKHLRFDFHIAYVLALLVIANYESYFIGVHEFATNLFFVSLAVASFEGTYGCVKKK